MDLHAAALKAEGTTETETGVRVVSTGTKVRILTYALHASGNHHPSLFPKGKK
jgi:hypothetical protein